MVYYKSYRIIDGKAKWIIEDEKGDIINRNPYKEELKLVAIKKRIRMDNRICCKCGNKDTYIDPSGKERCHNHIYDKENCTKSLCYTCGNEDYIRSVGIHDRTIIRINHDNTICHLCGSKYILIKSNGRPFWITFFFVCMDRSWKNVERIYIIPNSELYGETYLEIYKYIKEWYKEFRVGEILYNDTYHSVDIPEFFSPIDLWNGKYNSARCEKI